ncbi:hypothetical protein [Gordonia hongkongensis]|uniref:Uncharacterized protein n=1 Tax=Gordonia hongkongensis TaxID=1701090 RepID=A0ABT6BQT7_9ACTN|nr:hypothetical protein [Gordonia hongkongensis]MDF6100354.1 hypothetical protein [Gordonia hongkongensis]
MAALREAEEQQIVEFELGNLPGSRAGTLVSDQPLNEASDRTDREASTLEGEDEDAEGLSFRQTWDLRDLSELGDLLRVEMQFFGLPVEFDVGPRKALGNRPFESVDQEIEQMIR